MEHIELTKQVNDTLARIGRIYDALFQANGFNPYDATVMYALYTDDCCTPKSISENMNMPKQTVNTVTTRLKKQGYIESAVNEEDRRSVVMRLTASGREYATKVVVPVNSFDEAIIQKMGESRFEKLAELLSVYEAAASEELENRAKGVK